jgi:hypothetical protein
LLASRPTPIPEDQASVFISPRDRVVTHFSRLLWHSWVTVGYSAQISQKPAIVIGFLCIYFLSPSWLILVVYLKIFTSSSCNTPLDSSTYYASSGSM